MGEVLEDYVGARDERIKRAMGLFMTHERYNSLDTAEQLAIRLFVLALSFLLVASFLLLANEVLGFALLIAGFALFVVTPFSLIRASRASERTLSECFALVDRKVPYLSGIM